MAALPDVLTGSASASTPRRSTPRRPRAAAAGVEDVGEWDFVVDGGAQRARACRREVRPDARLGADRATWARIGARRARRDGRVPRAGACRSATTSTSASASSPPRAASPAPARLALRPRRAPRSATIALAPRPAPGDPVVLLHGLGGTKASFLPTVAALADAYRVIADRPARLRRLRQAGRRRLRRALLRPRGRSAARRARDRARAPDRQQHGRPRRARGRLRATPSASRRLALLAPSLAWLRERRWAPLLQGARGPSSGCIQPAPRPVVEPIVRRVVPAGDDGWPRPASTSSCARTSRRAAAPPSTPPRATSTSTSPRATTASGRGCASSQRDALFVWGAQGPARADRVRAPRRARRCPRRAHVELDCGHVPQLEAPRETHAADRRFLARRLSRAAPDVSREPAPPAESALTCRPSFSRSAPASAPAAPHAQPPSGTAAAGPAPAASCRARSPRAAPAASAAHHPHPRAPAAPSRRTCSRSRRRPSLPPARRRRLGARRRRRVAQRDQAAEHADVGRPVGPERDRRVVVVEAEALARRGACRPSCRCGSRARSGTRRRRSSALRVLRVRVDEPVGEPRASARPTARARRERQTVWQPGRRASRSTRSSPGEVVPAALRSRPGRCSRSCSRRRASGRCRSATGRSRSRPSRTPGWRQTWRGPLDRLPRR